MSSGVRWSGVVKRFRSFVLLVSGFGVVMGVVSCGGGAGSGGSSVAVSLVAGEGEGVVYVMRNDPKATKVLGVAMAKLVGVFNPLADDERDEEFEPSEVWGEYTGKVVRADYADASVGFSDETANGVETDLLELGQMLETARARAVADKFLADLGVNLATFQTRFSEDSDGREPTLYCTRLVEATPIDSLTFPCYVEIGENYKVTSARLSSRVFEPVGVVDVLSVEEAAVVDGRGVDVGGAKGVPVRVLTSVDVEGVSLLVPAWSVPSLDAAAGDLSGSLGVVLLAVDPDVVERLGKTRAR